MTAPTDWRPGCTIEVLQTRHRMLRQIRAFFEARGVIEVQTSRVGSTTVTDPAIESVKLEDGRYLQTSSEYQMKRLLSAGAPSIFEICSVFRAGERGRWHNPEFTMLEWYRLGFDDRALMLEVRELVDSLLGVAEYAECRYADLVGFDPATVSTAALRAMSDSHAALDRDEMLDLLAAGAIEAVGPARLFITDYPPDQAALARVVDGHAKRFELVVEGLELANGYHELADSDELRRRMGRDLDRRRAKGQSAVAPDEQLLAAQSFGFPDCAGVAVGFDRLVALAVGADDLASVMPFPADRA